METTLTLDGMTVSISLERTDDGPLLTIGGTDSCDLEGIAPGEYLLIPAGTHEAAFAQVRAS